MLELEIGGERLRLNPAAISALRYRAQYGKSVVTDLMGAATPEQLEACLIRLLHVMQEEEALSLLDMAALCRRDAQFLQKAIAARDALLDASKAQKHDEPVEGAEPFDEYRVLALMAAARLDMSLLHELPILHLLEVVTLCFEGRSEKKAYRPMNQKELHALYPR